MKTGHPISRVASALAIILGAVSLTPTAGCRGPAPKPADEAFIRAEKQWRAERLARLTAKDGWLTLVGLQWLQPGENTFGSDPANHVVLPGVAPHLGSFVLSAEGRVTLRALPGADLTLDGRPVTKKVLRSDADGKPDVLHVGRLRCYVIRRGNRFAIRIKDPQSPVRTHFKGLDDYPIDPSYRVEATFEPFAKPEKVAVPTGVGISEEMEAPGLVHFTLAGRKLSLKPLVESPGDTELFFIFRDATSGKETYGAGRFLYAKAPQNGRLVLDFNRAYNPPCAFTPYATCPLPPEGNDLPLPIHAGEKAYRGGHGG